MADNTIYIALGIPNNYLENTALEQLGQPYPLSHSYKTSLDTLSLLPPSPSYLSKSLSLHCKQIDKVKNELDGQPSIWLARMHVFNYKATFSPMHLLLVFVTFRQVTKIFFTSCLHLKKSIIIIAQNVALSVFYIGIFTLFNICLRMIIFMLFADKIGL